MDQQNIVAVNTTPAKPRRPDYREVRNRIYIVHFSVFPGIFVVKIPFFELKLLADPGFHPN